MTADEFIKGIAALLAWREEELNGVNGMLSVLFVVRNRVKAGWNGGDWGKIIEGHNQFSSMTVLGDKRTVAYPDVREPSFQRVLQEIDAIYSGETADTLTNGALYYYNRGPGVTPGGWFERTILANPKRFPRTATVGSTIYFGDLGHD